MLSKALCIGGKLSISDLFSLERVKWKLQPTRIQAYSSRVRWPLISGRSTNYTRTTRQAVVFSKQRRWSQPVLGMRWLKLKLAFLVFRELEYLGLSWDYTFRPYELSSGAGAGSLSG